MHTEYSTPCLNCRQNGKDTKGDNLKWFYNQNGKLTNKCVSCGTSLRQENQGKEESNRTLINADLLTNGRYESLQDRGISEETCRKFYVQVGELHGKPIHIYNYLNKEGPIVAQKIRFTQTKEFIWRGKNESLFGQYACMESDELFITEGELDALTLQQLGKNACGISTGAGDQTASEIKRHLNFLEQFKKIILVFDNDKVGQDTAQECLELFTPGKAYNVTLREYKDPNEYIKAGKEQQLIEELQNPQQFIPECIVTPKLNELLIEDKPRIILPYNQLQAYVRGVSQDEGELWLLGAGAKAGKSTFTKELIKGLLDENPSFKVAVCYTEESIKKAGQSFLAMDNNVPVQMYKEDMSLISKEKATESYNKYLKNKRIKFIDIQKMTLSSQKLINTLKHLVIGGGYKFIVLDHLSMFTYDMDSRNGERKDIDIFLRRLNSLTKELSFTILCICHLSRAGDGKDYSEGRAITMRDFRGSGSFEQLCDIMIALERNSLNEFEKSKLKVKVLANRITGQTGYVDELFYEDKTGRLITFDKLFK